MNIEKFVIDQQENDTEYIFYLRGELTKAQALISQIQMLKSPLCIIKAFMNWKLAV